MSAYWTLLLERLSHGRLHPSTCTTCGAPTITDTWQDTIADYDASAITSQDRFDAAWLRRHGVLTAVIPEHGTITLAPALVCDSCLFLVAHVCHMPVSGGTPPVAVLRALYAGVRHD